MISFNAYGYQIDNGSIMVPDFEYFDYEYYLNLCLLHFLQEKPCQYRN